MDIQISNYFQLQSVTMTILINISEQVILKILQLDSCLLKGNIYFEF